MKIAAVQLDIALLQPERNLRKVVDRLHAAARTGAQLVVFPECALSGYCMRSRREVEEAAVPATGAHWDGLIQACRSLNVFCVMGFLEKEGDRVFNTAGVFGPDGLVGRYRKVHRLVLGADRFTAPGNLGFPVFDLPIGRLGVNICYDQRFPESARIAMLGGAQIIVVPTNFPERARGVRDLLSRARAFENRVFYVVANRVGTERGTVFIGGSQIIGPYGEVLAQAADTEETIITATVDPALTDAKRTVHVPGEYEVDLVGDRRPECYGPMLETQS